MSIRREIARLVAGHQLFCLKSRFTGEETVRTLFVSQEVLDAVEPPPYAKDQFGYRQSEFREFLDAFLEGGHLSVAEDPDLKPSYAMLARVKPPKDQFWDFRVTAPVPGIRAFGGFAEFDTFVLLTWEYREDIPNFDAAVQRCKVTWHQLFGSATPFLGNHLNEYLSNYRAV